jgi:ArsR family transcriptional regulator, lead/cadmium/zinc/bismuth-responsive transcriptional repressor
MRWRCSTSTANGIATSARTCDYAGMASMTHSHPVNSDAVDQARSAVVSAEDAERLARLLGLLSDPVRVRVLFALVSVDELCVGDVAITLEVTMDQASYGLKMLRSADLVRTRRDGRVIYYRLADGFPHQLLEHCLRQLLTISTKEAI